MCALLGDFVLGTTQVAKQKGTYAEVIASTLTQMRFF